MSRTRQGGSAGRLGFLTAQRHGSCSSPTQNVEGTADFHLLVAERHQRATSQTLQHGHSLSSGPLFAEENGHLL
jgi:hypothetical protein